MFIVDKCQVLPRGPRGLCLKCPFLWASSMAVRRAGIWSPKRCRRLERLLSMDRSSFLLASMDLWSPSFSLLLNILNVFIVFQWVICSTSYLMWQISYTAFLLHFDLLLCSMATGMLILLNLLSQSGSVVCQVFQLSLNLCNMLHPGLTLCSSGLANAGGPDARGTDNTHK